MAPVPHHLALLPIVKALGYPGLFLIIFAESGVFFGFFLPGASLLFTAGILASQGFFNIWVLIFLLATAAVLGDNAGYWFGSKVGHTLFEKEDSRWFRKAHLHAAKEFYDTHGMQAVIFARFLPVIRTFAPIIAGIVHMDYRVFLAYNIAGGLIWGAGTAFAGYYLGEKVPFISEHLTVIMIVIVVITTVPIFWEFHKAQRRHRAKKAAE